jgi:peptidoglycan-associated lipoprotein
MRKTYLAQIILVGLTATLGLTGCHHKGKTGATGPGNGETPVPGINGGDTTSGIGSRPVGLTDLQHGQFAAVLFDVDSARIRPSEESKVEAVAAYLKSNPSKLVIEGHCDERGTAEYNRALGEHRALAARDELVRLGVDAGRMSTISYGKERPSDPGHDETAWSKNRRCEFVAVPQ